MAAITRRAPCSAAAILPAAPDPPEAKKQPPRPKLRGIPGPELITGASDDEPSGIANHSRAAAQYGYQLRWTMLFSRPLMRAIQAISARIGRVTGRGIAGILKKHWPLPILYAIASLLVVADTINLAADLGAIAAALKLLIGGPSLAYAAAFAAPPRGPRRRRARPAPRFPPAERRPLNAELALRLWHWWWRASKRRSKRSIGSGPARSRYGSRAAPIPAMMPRVAR